MDPVFLNDIEAPEHLETEDAQAQLALLLNRYQSAQNRRRNWEGIWEECYDYALPQRGGFEFDNRPGQRKTNDVYDATAMDAADRLASSMLGNLTPTWSQ